MRITRLGQGVDASRRLAPEAIERTLAVLREYREAIDAHGVERVRATATSAARDAANRDDFFAAATDALGVDARARVAARRRRGCRSPARPSDLDAPAPYLVVDIGGGFDRVRARDRRSRGAAARSTSAASASTEQWLHSDPPAPEELSNAVSAVRDELADVARAMPGSARRGDADRARRHGHDHRRDRAGAARSTTRERIHHFRLTRAAAEDVFRTLATEPRRRSSAQPGARARARRRDRRRRGRARLDPAHASAFDEVLVSEADILDGLVPARLRARAAARVSRHAEASGRPQRAENPGCGREIHHFGASRGAESRDGVTTARATGSSPCSTGSTPDDLHRVAERLESEALCDEVDWWRATIAIDKVVRHARRGRQAAHAASAAVERRPAGGAARGHRAPRRRRHARRARRRRRRPRPRGRPGGAPGHRDPARALGAGHRRRLTRPAGRGRVSRAGAASPRGSSGARRSTRARRRARGASPSSPVACGRRRGTSAGRAP